MNREKLSQEERIKREYYDLVGQWGIPIVHMGGLAATGELLELLQVNEKSTVLDVGCGTGFTACRIAKDYGCRVVGIDVSEKMISRSRERARKENVAIEFEVADATELPFEDGFFDVVIMESFLTIVAEASTIQKALHEVARVVKSGGRVGANEVFCDESTPPELRERIRGLLKGSMGPGQGLGRYTPTEFRAFFEDAGLTVIELIRKPTKQITRDLIKVMGWSGFIYYMFRVIYDIITSSKLRYGVVKAAPAKRIMERRKDTKKFFGFALIDAQKRE